jgi:hypothetical protein
MKTYHKPIVIVILSIVSAVSVLHAVDVYIPLRETALILGYGVFLVGVWFCAGSLSKSSNARTAYESVALALLGLSIAHQSIYGLFGIALILAWLDIRIRLGIEPKESQSKQPETE